MFCKYCGANIPAGSAVCPECGKVLKAGPTPAAGGVRAAAPFFLLIAILYVPALWELVRSLMLMPHPARILPPLLGPVLGSVILYFGVTREKIDIAGYRYSDALVLACLLLLVPWLSSAAESAFSAPCGDAFYVGAAVIFPLIKRILQLASAWAAVGVLLLGLGRKGTWKPGKKQLLAAAGVMLLLSLLGLTFARPAAAIYGASPETIMYATLICRTWSLLSWLWPAAVLLTFRRLGSGRIDPVGAALGFLGMLLAELILLPVLIFSLGLGPSGFAIAAGLPPLVPLLVTLLLSDGTRRPVWGKKAGD